MKLTKLTAFLAVILLAASCTGGPVFIPDNLSPAEIVQLAQEASDRNRYSVSLQYYQAILERFPNDIDNVCAAEYEIAFIHYKQKRYFIAKEGFNNLLERYDVPDGALLPQQFKILSHIVLERIDEIENSRRRR